MHSCDNRDCCNPNHLIKGDSRANTADRVFKCRSAAGMLNGRSKLNNKQVLDIFFDKRPKREIARSYGIDESTVRGIKTGKTWQYLTSHIPKL